MFQLPIKILPSLLAADFGALANDIKRVALSGADALHLDIMDAHFVPNLSFGPDIVRLSQRVAPHLYRHVHLMMTNPDHYIQTFYQAGAQTIQIHVEATCDIHKTIAEIHQLGLRAGLVLNPETPFENVLPFIYPKLLSSTINSTLPNDNSFINSNDEVLIMTVHPGYGGQKFISDCLAKISALRNIAPTLNIMVDGGINAETAIEVIRAGANQLVAGSYLFKQIDISATITNLRQLANNLLSSNP